MGICALAEMKDGEDDLGKDLLSRGPARPGSEEKHCMLREP